jgi:hypothetical protein
MRGAFNHAVVYEMSSGTYPQHVNDNHQGAYRIAARGRFDLRWRVSPTCSVQLSRLLKRSVDGQMIGMWIHGARVHRVVPRFG